MRKLQLIQTASVISVVGLVGCASPEKQTAPAAEIKPVVVKPAQTTLERKSGDKKMGGTVQFIPDPGGVKVVAHIEGLKPNSVHGFHIHETGDCSAADASSAGGHFNPDGQQHAGPADSTHHVGDMGNVKADKKGRVHLEQVFARMSLESGNPANIMGKAVVLHGRADDLKSQPAGDAGSRIGCGVIVEAH